MSTPTVRRRKFYVVHYYVKLAEFFTQQRAYADGMLCPCATLAPGKLPYPPSAPVTVQWVPQ